MMDYTLADTLTIPFTTRAFATGVPTTLAGSPVVSAYEDASLTQITAGITLGVDHDSVTGLHMLTIVASGANGFETGRSYHMVVTTGTVGGVSVVGEVVGGFTLGRSAAAVDLANGTDGLGAIKAETALIVADTSELQTDDVPGLVAALNDFNPSITPVEIVTAIASETASGASAERLVDMNADEVYTGATHNVAQSHAKRVRDLQEAGTYSGGVVYTDTEDGYAGTDPFVNGTEVRPSLTFADALTIAADSSVNAKRFKFTPDSSITLAATLNNRFLTGHGWGLALGGQDISGTHIFDATVSGIGTGSGIEIHNSTLNGVTLGVGILHNSYITGTFTLGAIGQYHFHNCHASDGSDPIINVGSAIGNTTVLMHNWHGNLEIQNLGVTGTDVVKMTGAGKVTINVNCTGGTVDLQGAWEVVDNSGGAVTINYDDNTSGIAATLLLASTDGVVVAPASKTGYSIGTGGITAASYAAGAIDSTALAASAASKIEAAVHAAVIESNGSITHAEILQALLSVVLGVTLTDGTVYKDPSGTTTRVTITYDAVNNERDTVVLNLG